MEVSNTKIARLFRQVAAALTIKKIGNVFQIRAYENAADSIEHSTVAVCDLWSEGKLSQVPGLGEKLQGYLDELFKTGQVTHFDETKKDIPAIVFDLLDIHGIGPKTAQTIASLGVKNLDDLKKKIKSGELTQKGFSSKVAQNILISLSSLHQQDNRMLLPYADSQAQKIIQYLKEDPNVLNAHALGSLRRRVATIGDLDFSVSSSEPKRVIKRFCKMPSVAKVLDFGEFKATVVLRSGIQVDLLVGPPDCYGALLQHFTGSKNHNIHLREVANEIGLSLSEHGVRKGDSGKIIKTKTEEEFYKLLKMQVPPPEIREDGGEIEALRQVRGKLGGLPDLVELSDIKGDFHLHSNFEIKNPSHGPGADSMENIVKKTSQLGYKTIGISDHPPGHTTSSKEAIIDWVKKRTKFIQNLNLKTKSIRVLNGLEIDILGNGDLSVPDEALKTLDYCIAGIHSGHRGSKEVITRRLLSALNSPYVDIISHPTNRLLNERESSEADWPEIFRVAGLNKKILEINCAPNRLDLRDDLVKLAIGYGVKFIINTDAHEVEQMDNMLYGVSVARRGWAKKSDIVNSWDWTKFSDWFKIKS